MLSRLAEESLRYSLLAKLCCEPQCVQNLSFLAVRQWPRYVVTPDFSVYCHHPYPPLKRSLIYLDLGPIGELNLSYCFAVITRLQPTSPSCSLLRSQHSGNTPRPITCQAVASQARSSAPRRYKSRCVWGGDASEDETQNDHLSFLVSISECHTRTLAEDRFTQARR